MKRIVFLALMVSICISATPTYFLGNVQCACQQFLSQSECSGNRYCNWVTLPATPGVTIVPGYCTQYACSAFTTSTLCLSQPQCYYTPSSGTSTTEQVCFNFTSCTSIILATNQTCSQANYMCVSNSSTAAGASQCVLASTCAKLTEAQCSGQAGTTQTSAGLCYWAGSQCKVIEECKEITSQNICQNSLLSQSCMWNTKNNQCIALTCNAIQSQQQCKYINLSPGSQPNVQPCQWIEPVAPATQGTCVSTSITALTQSLCASNTNFFYRWVGNQQQGFCAQCNAARHVYRNQCECDQILQATECNSSTNCTWSTNTCIQKPCSQYYTQQICSQTKGCYWNLSAETQNCQTLTSCNQITGTTQAYCLASSINCPTTNSTNCQERGQLQTCEQYATYKNISSGNSTLLPSVCYNSVGTDGFCTYTPLTNTTGTCGSISSCANLTTKQLCDQFINSCIWVYGKKCQIKTCASFLTKETCTFVQPSINTNNNAIQICYWNPNINQCVTFDNSLDFDINSCYLSTGGTHHWSEPTNAQKGFCIPCKLNSLLNIKSECSCTELTNYTDCALASPKCMWNAKTQTCADQNCSYLTIQAQCVLSSLCYWKISNNGLAGSCQAIGSNSNSCSTLNGTTQQECLSQALECPGVTSNGKCSSSLNSCSSFKTYYTCFGSVGTDGICQWNEINAQCSGISSCEMISTPTQCELVKNTCYWSVNTTNSTLDSCQSYNCSTLYTQTGQCSYFLSQPNQNYVVNQCMLSNNNCAQSSNGLQNLTSSTCYANSGRSAKWTKQSDGNYTCQFCSAQLLTILLLIVAIIA